MVRIADAHRRRPEARDVVAAAAAQGAVDEDMAGRAGSDWGIIDSIVASASVY